MYYIVSLKHTNKEDKFITLWRPDNKGYCFATEMAGIYDTPQNGYHNDEGNLPILISLADSLKVTPQKHWDFKKAIPNNSKTWQAIGVKWHKRNLIKTQQPTNQ